LRCKRGRFPPVFSPGLVILRRETELVEGKDPVTLCSAGSSATPSPKGSALKNLDAFVTLSIFANASFVVIEFAQTTCLTFSILDTSLLF